jgi:hypothetical protein
MHRRYAEALEICTEGMQKHRTVDEYVEAW